MSQEKGKDVAKGGEDTRVICGFSEMLVELTKDMNSRLKEIEWRLSQGVAPLSVPEFNGGCSPDAYLEWEAEADAFVACFSGSEVTKVKYVATGLTDYAIIWWMRRCEEKPVKTWSEMKEVMRKRFVPKHYYREQYKKLQSLTQGSKTPEEYYREMEVTMMRAGVKEDHEAIMTRYLSGLNPEIANLVEMFEYDSAIDMVHQATKVYKSTQTD